MQMERATRRYLTMKRATDYHIKEAYTLAVHVIGIYDLYRD